MNISDAAALCELTPKAIRHYEDQGLISPARSANGYRDYRERDLQELKFLAHSRAMGFSLQECSHLLELYRNPGRASADVKALAEQKLQELDLQMQKLKDLRSSLSSWVQHCPGDQSPNCPIIQQLARSEENP